ncbi:hypothetical protein Tco_0798950 [Tanacetum coccineum]
MDDPNITMEEYIRLEEEKARRCGKVYNWKTATYGKIWYDEDVHDLRSVETKFPAIVFNDSLTSNETPSCEPTVSSLNDEIDFRISFNESDDEDYTNEFPAIVYNDALTSKSDFLTEPTVSPQLIDEFNLKDEISLFKCDEEEQNVLYFNDLFSFNVIYPDDSKSGENNDDDKINIEHSSGDLSVKPLPDVINIDVGAYAQGTVYTTYSLNEYNVFDTGINTAYPGEWIRRIDFLYSFRVLYKVEDIATCLVEYVKFWDDWEVDHYGNANLAVMSSSTVTYTSIFSDYEEPSDAGSPRVIVYGYDGLPMHPVDPYVEAALQAPGQAPPSPDYILGPEHPPSPDCVHGLEPLPADASPAALSPGYIAESDPKEDPEEDSEEDPEEDPDEDPAYYLADGGDNADDESSDDDEEQEASKDDDEEDEHLAPADSSVVPTIDPVPSAEDTEAFETNESAPTPVPSSRRRMDRMFIRPQIPMSNTAEALIAEIRLRAASPSTHHPSEIPSPPLLLPSTTHRYDLLEADMPLWKRARFTTPIGRFEIGESSSAAAARQAGHTLAHRVDYGFMDTMDASIRTAESRAMTAIGEINERVTDLATTQRQDARELYMHCEDAQDDRALLGAQAIEAQIRALQRDIDVLLRQRIRDKDRLTAHIQHDHDKFRDLKMPPKKRTVTTTTTTTPMTDAQLKALIAQGVADALAERDTTEVGMATTVMIQEVTEEGECLLLESVPTMTSSNVNP